MVDDERIVCRSFSRDLLAQNCHRAVVRRRKQLAALRQWPLSAQVSEKKRRER